MAESLLDVDGVSRIYGGGWQRIFRARAPTVALDAVSLSIDAGEAFGLVGESGSGKSTLARLVAGLEAPDEGRIRRIGNGRGSVQMVFQNPSSSLNPRKTVRQILDPPLRYLRGMGKSERADRMSELMEAVDLESGLLARYAHELSGGQAQRVALARALAAEPDLLVLDEATAALDVLVQARIVDLLDKLRERFGLTLLFISHDLALVAQLCGRLAVLREGRVVETGETQALIAEPQESYTQMLIENIPTPDRRLWD